MTTTSDTDITAEVLAAEAQKRSAYIAGLRALADALDAHPEIPVPYAGSQSNPLSIGFHGYEFEADRVTAMTTAARVLMPGRRDKNADNAYYRVRGTLHGLHVEVWAMREQVCEKVVKGTRQVTREVPDPDALMAVPTTTVTETVEDVEWVCRPLLAEDQPTYDELGGTGSWCVTGTHGETCTCAVEGGTGTAAATE